VYATRDDLRRLLDDLSELAARAASLDCKALAIVLGAAYVAAAEGGLDELADLVTLDVILNGRGPERN
jgi:hypothetical protein